MVLEHIYTCHDCENYHDLYKRAIIYKTSYIYINPLVMQYVVLYM